MSINSYGTSIQIIQNNNSKKFCISSITDKGKLKDVNQDNLLIKYGETALGDCVLLAVADGVGGLNRGEIASLAVIEKLTDWWNITLGGIELKNDKYVKQIINESLNAAINNINFEIFEKGDKSGYKMGTTLTLLFILNNWYCIKHAGDSRVYKLSDNMQQLTMDDNLLNRYIMSGAKSELIMGYEAMTNTITKCIGVKSYIELQELSGVLEEEDNFMLCTDGFYKHIKFNEINKCISNCHKGALKSQEVLRKMVLRARNRGESDDISSIVLTPCKNSSSLLKRLIML